MMYFNPWQIRGLSTIQYNRFSWMRRFIKVIDKYGLTELLGEGMYGKVYKGINIQNNEDVAVKVIQSDKFVRNPQLEEYTLNEIKVLTDLGDTPHIVRYLDMLKTANNYYFVYEYCNGGTLEKQISSYRNTPEKVVPLAKSITYFGEILSAFKLLTRNKIMHRDLKPDNILLHNGKIKIADFGFSKSLRSPTDLAQTMLGSPIYMAPEVLNGDPYTMKADIWSLGVVLYEMVFGVCPFQSQQIGKLIQTLQVEEVKYPKPIPPALQNLLRRMLVKDASKRIDWADLFEYKVTQNGQLIEPSFNKTLKQVVGGFGSSSGYSMTRVISGGSTANESQQSRKSPMPNDRPSKPQYTSNIRPQQRYPPTNVAMRDYHAQLRQFKNTHERMISAVKLSMDVLRRPPKESFALAFVINRIVYKQINSILDFLDKNWGGNTHFDQSDQSVEVHFKEIVIQELIKLSSHLESFKAVVESLQGDANMIEFKKNKYLKNFYKVYRPYLDEDQEGIVLISQLLDFFEDPTSFKKDPYKRLQKGEFLRQIQARLNKLQ